MKNKAEVVMQTPHPMLPTPEWALVVFNVPPFQMNRRRVKREYNKAVRRARKMMRKRLLDT